jgi:urea carboxylase
VRRVLVANRGEIACRIIRTLDRLGIESVAVYSDADRAAPHVGMATHRVALGPAPPAASYLSIERILAAAEQTEADAIHPGYGFLSEHADFAAAVERAGIVFVGPTPDHLRNFGTKHTARALAENAGVPLLPGSPAFAQTDRASEHASRVGFPLLVKSVAGGGGIGMVQCDSADTLADAVERAMRQADQAFGDPRVFLERFVARARHVEVQAFGNGAGEIAVLGERDCSTQRRRQKVIEEAPAPGLDGAARVALGAAAKRLLGAQRYRSAGTVEFVADRDTGEFFFLEVNTRLQVEHPVTEAIAGVDLVEWMLRLAAGDDPGAGYEHRPKGHSIEARVYAEDPAKDFLPCSGLVTDACWPANVRVDTWVEAGTEIGPFYDPLLAKIIVHAETRSGAVEQLGAALAETRVAGIETNLDLLRSFVQSGTFRAPTITTSSLENHTPRLATVDVIAGGGSTTVQDFPGRVRYWNVGVPPSGPMDDRSFRLGNAMLGNDEGAPGLECTANGPALRFNIDASVCLTGAPMRATVDGVDAPWGEPLPIAAGSTLSIGSLLGAGLRSYLLVAGGFDVPDYLGSAATFTLGRFGGHGGRELRAGDVLHLAPGTATRAARPIEPLPEITHDWRLGVSDGPHGAPDFITAAGIEALYEAIWEVHYNSSRTGVRLVGPKPEWARPDGGESGLHPSNIHDSAYTVGAVDFTGDMPILLGPDGPSLGGFVCPFTVVTDERWKLGQLAPGDRVRFVRAPAPRDARPTRGPLRPVPNASPAVLGVRPARDGAPSVVYRQSGDRALLVEYGPMVLDLDLRLRAHALAEWLDAAAIEGIVDVTPGIRSLQIQVDGTTASIASLLPRVQAAEAELPTLAELEVPSRVVHLPLSWDDPATRDAIERYTRGVRDDAPWCPWNIEFIRRVNGLDHVDDVRRIVFDAEYLVLGLGDVYLGAPVAVPIDPRHRLVTTKYNPARTWTPENAVGIGGAYLCVYGMEGPGGYQFVGRTVPVWHPYGSSPHTTPDQPWLLRFFDRIRWYPVAADVLLDMRAESQAGRLELQIEEGTFSRAQYRALLADHDVEISGFRTQREAAFAAERAEWERKGEFARVDVTESVARVDATDAVRASLPDGAIVVESFLHACVWKVHVSEGQTVAPGDVVVTVEAMKMETAITAPTGGIVDRVVCDEGQIVMPGAALVVLVADG